MSVDTVPQPMAVYSRLFLGPGRVHEPVTTTGAPLVARRVRLVDQRTGIQIAEAFSDPADGGNVAFAGLALDRLYLLYAIDDSQTWQAVQISHRYATVTGARVGA